MEEKVDTVKLSALGKKRATRKRQPIKLDDTACCELYSVENFDNVQKLDNDEVVLSDKEDEVHDSKTRLTRSSTTTTPTKQYCHTICIDSDDKLNSNQLNGGSPSPPTPPPELRTEGRPTKACQKMTRTLKYVDEAVSSYHAINELMNSSDLASPRTSGLLITLDESPSPKKRRKAVVVKIRSKLGLHRTVVQRDEAFRVVFEELAQKEGVSTNNIMLSRGEQTIRYTDTPASVNLEIADILDCVVVDATLNSSLQEEQSEEDVVRVKLQGLAKSSFTVITIAKTSSFHELLKLYSKFLGVAEKSITLSFDGDLLDLDSTPADLDVDNDDIIDARIDR